MARASRRDLSRASTPTSRGRPSIAPDLLPAEKEEERGGSPQGLETAHGQKRRCPPHAEVEEVEQVESTSEAPPFHCQRRRCFLEPAQKPGALVRWASSPSSTPQAIGLNSGLRSPSRGSGSCCATSEPRLAQHEEQEEPLLDVEPRSALSSDNYFAIASCLAASELCRLDQTCRDLRTLNGLSRGPWQSLGECSFHGMALNVHGKFLPFALEHACGSLSRPSWKLAFAAFSRKIMSFGKPFNGPRISKLVHNDEVAYCRVRLRADLLAELPRSGVYMEVEVLRNADNLGLALVDFDGGGHSSVTFSPETGAVLRERLVSKRTSSVSASASVSASQWSGEREVQGEFIQLLKAGPPQKRFHGSLGLFLRGGDLAFLRRWKLGAWETTGFCTSVPWVRSPRLSACLAFRDKGNYDVRIVHVGRTPPVPIKVSEKALKEKGWRILSRDEDYPMAG